ncbi:hypothetical protein L3476_24930 [Paenibacillus thiaminolyticus]|uniref:hypothetical protein n=1 Tax=Paenibacillus thiaminolyticus TaxID=49283 RepID=UPI002350E2D3|nr:hypothetical protein [Paenibacillus thiaminolyticus]WCR26439.1 hypothetical protein L3476_24930 [Paenibacillus thiaminolyticus]
MEEFLQNNINLKHLNGLKAKIGENDALLQESHPIATQLAKIAAFTQDYAAASVFRGITGYSFPRHYRLPFSAALPATVFRGIPRRRLPRFPPSSQSRLCRSPLFNEVGGSPFLDMAAYIENDKKIC